MSTDSHRSLCVLANSYCQRGLARALMGPQPPVEMCCSSAVGFVS
jgi:hypothetical protein